MLKLKDYQDRVLDALTDYFKSYAETGCANTAFYKVTNKVFGTGLTFREIDILPGLPYVCLRIPTGGGKTLVACNSIARVNEELLQTENSTVLWLVPSTPILNQTLKALNNKNHPYRMALEAQLGNVNILDIKEALRVKKTTLDGGTTIIVSTMQSFRIEEPEGRKVYQSSGDLMEHFSGLSNEILDDLKMTNPDGPYAYSLANVLRIRRPLIIVDEAHNSRTELSFDTLARFNPSCILEYTATPDTRNNPSNVLYSVSAAELKAEAMIKIPLKLETKDNWQELLSDSIARRNELEQYAKGEKEYIRPIMLIQAQPKIQGRDNLTVDVIENSLINDHNIPKEEIAVQAYNRKDLDSVENILDKECKIKYVITISSLREGWDCPFAYVLCSFAELSTNVGVEQILGRIIRLPNATWKENEHLNNSYAYVLSANFFATANSLRSALVESGFNKQEVSDLIVKMSSKNTQPEFIFEEEEEYFVGDEFFELEINEDSFSTTLLSTPNFSLQTKDLVEKFHDHDEGTRKVCNIEEDNNTSKTEVSSKDKNSKEYRNKANSKEGADEWVLQEGERVFDSGTEPKGGHIDIIKNKVVFDNEEKKIIIKGDLTPAEKKHVEDLFTNEKDRKNLNRVFKLIKKISPSERGQKFEVPLLAYKQGDLFEVFEETHFLNRKWNINDFDKSLTEEEFPKERPTGLRGEITVSDEGKVSSQFLDNLVNQMVFHSVDNSWTLPDLVYWLSKKINTPDIPYWHSEPFLNSLIMNLINDREIPLQQLVVDKFRLKNAITKKISIHRDTARKVNYQTVLFDDDTLTVTSEVSMAFNPKEYPFSIPYSGSHKFNKHYYPTIGDMKDVGEEFEYAQFIDNLPQVKFWVRNLPRRPQHSFWLQTSTDKFYPDFVCLLEDKRYLVVEYKGFDRWTDDDSKEKRNLGELWEKKSNGSCLFLMPRGKDFDSLLAKISK